MVKLVDYNINLKKERLEIPIYFGEKIDEDGIRDMFEIAIADLLARYEIKDGEIFDKS